MSQPHPSASNNNNFQSVFDAALEAYEKKTKTKLHTHPLAAQIQSCESPTAILSVLQGLSQQIDRRGSSDQRLTNWLNPTVKVLHAFSAIVGDGVGLAFSPASVVCSGIGILLSAAKDVAANLDVLIDIFARIENFFKRLESYTEVPPTAAMTDVILKIIIEVLSILAITTKELKQGRSKTFVKKLLGRNGIEDALKRLDTLTMEETRMAIAETLKVTNRVDDKVTALIDDVKEANAAIQRSADTADVEKQSQLREKLKKWLSPPNPSINHNIARKAHHEGTASWFFQGAVFEQWKSSPLLWIHGKPGSGKSILCSGIIEDIKAQHEAASAIVLYFYCDFRDEDKQNCRNLVLSIIWQLCTQSDLCYDKLSRLYSEHDSGAQNPSDETLTKCLTEMLSLPDQCPIYLVVDALDECPNNSGMPTPREEVLDLVQNLVSLGLPNLHICITSRPEIDIQTALEPLTTLRVSLHNQSGQKKDIVDYVSSVVYSDTKMRRWREEDRKLVIERLSERADGMFRWVYCQLEALRHSLAPSVRKILEELPETLDETYEQVLKEINKANREHARRLLQCLTVAVRPLRVEELAEVLAIDFDAAAHGGIPQLNPNWRWTNQHEAVLSTCSSLIAIGDDDEGSQVVQFSHFSVKEFLTSDRLARSSGATSRYHILLAPAHAILAQACLGVLLRLDRKTIKNFLPLVDYADRHWVDHAQVEDVSSRIRDSMEYFFDADKPHWAPWRRDQRVDKAWQRFKPERRSLAGRAPPLYFASLCGFYDLAEHLGGKHPEHVNWSGGWLVTPLVAALFGKHFQIAELLHREDADVDILSDLDSKGTTLLNAACQDGFLDIAEWLLNHGANVNIKGYGRWTSLHDAVFNGRLQVLQMLIGHNADIDIRNAFGVSPLHMASNPQDERDQVAIMRALLDHGANPNARDNHDATPLHHSSWWHGSDSPSRHGSVEGTRLLLEHGAVIDAEDNEGRTPLQLALEHRRDDIVACLKEHGATR